MSEASDQPRLLAPIALVTSRFPLVTETFILRELVELDRRGLPVVLVPLLRETPATVHPEAVPWNEGALHSPLVSAAVLRDNLRVLLSHPLRWFGSLSRLLWASRGSRNAFGGAFGILLRSVHEGRRIRASGVRHVHAHYATHPAAAAWLMSRVAGGPAETLPFSVTAHAHDIFVTQAGLALKLNDAAFVRCISSFNAGFLSERLGAPEPGEDRYPVIHCGIRPEDYTHEPLPGRPLVDRPARVLCVASHQPYKGLGHLIDAMGSLHARGLQVECDVIGDGWMRPQLETRIQRAGLEQVVRLQGARPQAEVARALSRADLFVLPSIVASNGQMEGIPVALMEAMACGVPVVATELSGVPELVRHEETGLLVPPGDSESLALAMERALAGDEDGRERVQRGRDLVRREFDLRGVVTELLDRLRSEGVELPPEEPWTSMAASALSLSDRPEGTDVGLLGSWSGADAHVAKLLLPERGQAPRRVVVKRHRDRDGAVSSARDRAGNEHAALKQLAGLDPESKVSVPRALGCEPGAATVLMTAGEGESLQQLLRRARFGGSESKARALAGLSLAGRFLDLLAERPCEAGDDVPARLLREAEEDAGRCGALDLPAGPVAALLDATREGAARLGRDARLALSHGDFWPGNLLVAPGATGATIIDLEGLRPGLGQEDRANLLEHLALLLPLRALRRSWERAFLGTASEPAGWLRAAKALRIAARNPNFAKAGLAGRLAAARGRARLRALAKELRS